jgi:uncharacterized RmlC-like cupin family protein
VNFKTLLVISLILSSWVMTLAAQQIPTADPNPKIMEKVGASISRVRPVNTPYEKWFAKAKETIPTFEGMVIQDARTIPLKPWQGMGVDGLYIKMADYQITDGWILEIPANGQTKPQRHMFEAGMYFFGGPGHIVIQQEDKQPLRIEFDYRSLFSIPLNVRYQLFNDSDEPVRVVAVTSFPFVMNSTNNEEFIFNNPFEFRDRYNAEEGYSERNEHVYQNQSITNVVPDALEFELDEYDHRGKNSTNMHWDMSGNTMIELHVSEIPPGAYKKAHRHSSDAFILLLSGEGYSLTWPEGRYEDRVGVNWHEGTIFVPPIYWYHQHLNPGTTAARYLAINAPNLVTNLGLRFEDQIESDLPQIREEFEAAVTKSLTDAKQE